MLALLGSLVRGMSVHTYSFTNFALFAGSQLKIINTGNTGNQNHPDLKEVLSYAVLSEVQSDLNELENWSDRWQIGFNCYKIAYLF